LRAAEGSPARRRRRSPDHLAPLAGRGRDPRATRIPGERHNLPTSSADCDRCDLARGALPPERLAEPAVRGAGKSRKRARETNSAAPI
jgi:hypothetical protein